jgi:uncharacterized protein (DUF983 family)
MVKKLWLGFCLRCPHCQKGRMSDGLFSIRKACDVCHVVYERKSGESAGAMGLLMTSLPILPLILFFVLYNINQEWGLPILLGLPIALTVLSGLVIYRHIRGLWIAVAYLTGNVYADDVDAAQ